MKDYGDKDDYGFFWGEAAGNKGYVPCNMVSEGQLIKVYGDKDADGFYWGEAAGHKGYVPCNMVSEVQVDDDRVAEELFKEQTTVGNNNKVKVTATTPVTTNAGPVYDDRWGDIYEDMP